MLMTKFTTSVLFIIAISSWAQAASLCSEVLNNVEGANVIRVNFGGRTANAALEPSDVAPSKALEIAASQHLKTEETAEILPFQIPANAAPGEADLHQQTVMNDTMKFFVKLTTLASQPEHNSFGQYFTFDLTQNEVWRLSDNFEVSKENIAIFKAQGLDVHELEAALTKTESTLQDNDFWQRLEDQGFSKAPGPMDRYLPQVPPEIAEKISEIDFEAAIAMLDLGYLDLSRGLGDPVSMVIRWVSMNGRALRDTVEVLESSLPKLNALRSQIDFKNSDLSDLQRTLGRIRELAESKTLKDIASGAERSPFAKVRQVGKDYLRLSEQARLVLNNFRGAQGWAEQPIRPVVVLTGEKLRRFSVLIQTTPKSARATYFLKKLVQTLESPNLKLQFTKTEAEEFAHRLRLEEMFSARSAKHALGWPGMMYLERYEREQSRQLRDLAAKARLLFSQLVADQ